MRRKVPAAVACVAALAALTAGCGNTAGVSAAPANLLTGATPAEKLESLDTAILGDRMAWTIRGWRAHQLLQDTIRSCMSAQGLDYRPPPFIASNDPAAAQYVDWLDPVADPALLTLTPPSEYMSWSAREIARKGGTSLSPEWGNPGFSELDEEGQAAYTQALNHCTPNEDDSAVSQPAPAAAGLHEQLITAVADALRLSPNGTTAVPGYRDCMAKAGFDVEDVADLRSDLSTKAGAVLEKDGLDAAKKPTAAWTSYLEVECTAAAADQGCRADAHRVAMTAIAPVLDEFAADHGAEIAKAQAQWQELDRQYADALRAALAAS